MRKSMPLVVACVLLVSSPVAGQQPTEEEINQYIELVRADVRQERAEIVGSGDAALGRGGEQVLATLRRVRERVHEAG